MSYDTNQTYRAEGRATKLPTELGAQCYVAGWFNYLIKSWNSELFNIFIIKNYVYVGIK